MRDKNIKFSAVNAMIVREIQERVDEAVNVRWMEYNPPKDETTAREDTVQILKAYPTVKGFVERTQERVDELDAYFKSIEELELRERKFSESTKTYKAKLDLKDRLTSELIIARALIEDVEYALSKVENASAYKLLKSRYVDGMVDKEIVAKYNLPTRAINYPIFQLVDIMAYYLVPIKALRECVYRSKRTQWEVLDPSYKVFETKRGRPKKQKPNS